MIRASTWLDAGDETWRAEAQFSELSESLYTRHGIISCWSINVYRCIAASLHHVSYCPVEYHNPPLLSFIKYRVTYDEPSDKNNYRITG